MIRGIVMHGLCGSVFDNSVCDGYSFLDWRLLEDDDYPVSVVR